jgi:hypothetical protein
LLDNWAHGSTEQAQESKSQINPLVSFQRSPSPLRRFEVLQCFEGTIQEVNADSFWAELRDLTNTSNPPESIELPRSEVSAPDHPLLEPGGIFYWSIGYETSPTGQIRRVAEIRMRRSPEWSERTIASVQAQAAEWFKRLASNGAENSTSNK